MCTIYASSYRFINSCHNPTPTDWGSTNLCSSEGYEDHNHPCCWITFTVNYFINSFRPICLQLGEVGWPHGLRPVQSIRGAVGAEPGALSRCPPAGVPIQVPPVGDGEANADVVQNIDPPVPVIDAGQEGASVMGLDPRKFEELISTSIAKGVEIGVAKALAILEPGRSAPTHVASDGPIPSTSSATSTLPSRSLPVPSVAPASTSNLQQSTPSSAFFCQHHRSLLPASTATR